MVFAVFLNEIQCKPFKKFVQTVTTLPNFISWVLVYALAFSLFSTSGSLTVDSTSLKTGSANTVTGLVSLALSAPFEELSLNSVTGDLCVDAPITACDAILRSVTGRLHTSGVSITEGAARISATTVSSDLDITSTLDPVPEA